ncbi:LysR family transcriptional regulator [Shewanella waksmanii]|uniref:LysR family transcriptional regulator n=1 Tax=Shewanella waksmanii TaxID=213783 RepID=UPI0037359005
MDIKQLNHLHTLAKCGSFTKAASELNIAQPAISQSIKRLEQELGVLLINRNAHHRGQKGSRLALTSEGLALNDHAKVILQQVAQAKRHLQDLANLSRGEVRVAVPGMLGSYYLPRRLMAFRHQYPSLKLSLFEGGTRDTLRMLQNEEVDIAIITEQDLTDELDSQCLLTAQMVVAMAEDHPLAALSAVPLPDFFEHELVMFKPGYFHREWMLKHAQRLNIDVNIAFETNLINLIKQVVSQGYAITSVLEMVIEKNDPIIAKPFDPAVNLDLHIAWHKKRPLGQADRAFFEFLMQNR